MKDSKLKSKQRRIKKGKPDYELFTSIFFTFVIEEDGNVPEILLIEEDTKTFLPVDSKHKNMPGVKKLYCHNKHLDRFKKAIAENGLGNKATFSSTGLIVSTKQGCYVFIPSVYELVEEEKISFITTKRKAS